MGSGASSGLAVATSKATDGDLLKALEHFPQNERRRLQGALEQLARADVPEPVANSTAQGGAPHVEPNAAPLNNSDEGLVRDGLQRGSDGRGFGPVFWGMTRRQMQEFYTKCTKRADWTDEVDVRVMVARDIKPMTGGTGLGVAMSMNKANPLKATLLISHCWNENAKRFFEDIHTYALDSEVAFVCFLALYQGTPEEIQLQVGSDILRGCFALVVTEVGRVLVVPNEELRENGQGLYSRMWCVWECFVAATHEKPIDFTHRSSRKHLFGADSANFTSEKARCGLGVVRNADEIAIRRVIEDQHFKVKTPGMLIAEMGGTKAARAMGVEVTEAAERTVFQAEEAKRKRGDVTAEDHRSGYVRIDRVISSASHNGAGANHPSAPDAIYGNLRRIASELRGKSENILVTPGGLYDQTIDKQFFRELVVGLMEEYLLEGEMKITITASDANRLYEKLDHDGTESVELFYFCCNRPTAMAGNAKISFHDWPLSGPMPPADFTQLWKWDGALMAQGVPGQIIVGSHVICSVCIPKGPPIAAQIDLIEKKAYIRRIANEAVVWLCLEDIGPSIPLKDSMVIKFSDIWNGPVIKVVANAQTVTVTDSNGKVLGCFTEDFCFGRTASGPDDPPKCVLDFDCVSRNHGRIHRTGSGWAYAGQTAEDSERLKRTWMLLSKDVAYLIPKGVKDGKIGLVVSEERYLLGWQERR
mmetsp:Transcript_87038/g.244075  ORF Transcript_87038/g.244075 Transcript_87038/m.244075 type:complete len:702 (-) Transcript_87038:115-2220(-)